jgi:hypothetical protein
MPDAPGSHGRSTAGPLAGHATSQIEGKPTTPPPRPPPPRGLDAAAESRVLETLAGLADCRALARGAGEPSPTPRGREYLASRLARLSPAATWHVSSEECAPSTDVRPRVANLLAIVPGRPGSGRRAIYLVAGFDAEPGPHESRYDGACAAAIEAIRTLSLEPLLASVVLVLCDGGTRDALGAAFRANAARQMHAFDVAAVLCAGEINAPGRWGDEPAPPDRVRVFGGGGGARGPVQADDSPGRQIARVLEEVARLHDLPTKVTIVARDQPRPAHADASRFLEQGFPVATLHEPAPHGGNTASPDAPYVTGVARVLGAAAGRLALAPPPPAGVSLEDRTIRWHASDEHDLAGYEIVWRATTAPIWEHAHWVARVDRALVPADPSTHVFGVVGVGRSGHRGPAALAGDAG